MNNKYIILAHIASIAVLTLAGCSTPPAHTANWYYYWKEGAVVADMDKVHYLWQDPPTTIGVSSPQKSTTEVGLSDDVLSSMTELSVVNKNNPSIQEEIIANTDGGIDVVATTIAHEFKHIWIYQQWGAVIGHTGIINGLKHTDGDAIPDSVEKDRTPGSIGATYEFAYNDADTLDLGSVGGWGDYSIYGDNELLARIEGVINPRSTTPASDWSVGGKNWGNH